MREALDFVKGAVAKKDLVPALTHFHIHAGRVTGYNGRIAISSPIALDIDACPQAATFIRAIDACEDVIAIGLTDAGRLSVRSGSFRTLVPCTTEQFPGIAHAGSFVQLGGNLLDALRALLPFVAEDASRQWAQGVLLKGASAFATNNVVAVQRWLGYTFPCATNIPKDTVLELLRIGEEPLGLQIAPHCITFFYEGDRWLWSSLYDLGWPDVEAILSAPSQQVDIPQEMFEALRTVAPFADKSGRVWLSPTGVATAQDGSGAAFDIPLPVQQEAIFHVDQLLLIADVAHTADFSLYPRPCIFYGQGIRGAVVGMRA